MKREFSIEDGFQIVMLFLTDFWWNFIKKKMIKKELINLEELNPEKQKTISSEEKIKNDLHADNNFFFLFVCDGTSDEYFEKVIEQTMQIPPMKQHDGLIVKENVLFQLAIDFCENFNKRFLKEGRDSLRFAIDWLEDMRNHQEKHKIAWDIWNQVVTDVTEHGQKSIGFF